MGDVSTAVGCAVGIPIGVAVLVLFLFWVRLQRRFQKERADDEELERQIYDETGSIDFTNGIANIHAMEGHREDTNNASDKTEPYVNTDDSFNMIDSSTNTSDVEKSNNNNNSNNAKSNSSTTRATVSRNNSGNVYVPAYRKGSTRCKCMDSTALQLCRVCTTPLTTTQRHPYPVFLVYLNKGPFLARNYHRLP